MQLKSHPRKCINAIKPAALKYGFHKFLKKLNILTSKESTHFTFFIFKSNPISFITELFFDFYCHILNQMGVVVIKNLPRPIITRLPLPQLKLNSGSS